MARAQRVDETNGAICLAITFSSRVMVIKMSKNFPADDNIAWRPEGLIPPPPS